MPNAKYREDRHPVERTALFEHASLALAGATAAGLPQIKDWLGAAYRKEPVTIYDINGQPLFHDIAVVRGGEVFGHVRLAASRVVGPPVVSLDYGPRRWDFAAATAKLAPRVKREFPRAVISPPRLVCYCYPKLGVMYEVDVAGKKQRAIYDVASLARVPELPSRTDHEGFFAYSYFDSLDDAARAARLKRYGQQDLVLAKIPSRERAKLQTLTATRSILDKIVIHLKWGTKLLQYSSFYGPSHARAHHCFQLTGQQKDDYCAVATCQMVLAYYRYDYSQDDIAPKLGYSGGCPPDTSAGYETLTCNHLDAAFDSAPTFAKARQEINALHPFKSGIYGHARACAGYSHFSTYQWLYIYDPSPWDADYALGGEVKWEDWDAITHTNYVTTKIKCP